MSGDIRKALTKIHGIARRAAYLTFPIIHLPFDWEVYRAIGREWKKPPPYIYIVNMLFQMGVMANIEILHSRIKVQYRSVDETIESLRWRTDPFTPEKLVKLRNFLEVRFAACGGDGVLTYEGKSQWALIW